MTEIKATTFKNAEYKKNDVKAACFVVTGFPFISQRENFSSQTFRDKAEQTCRSIQNPAKLNCTNH